MNRRLYAIHRWISALAFVQLALWTISGSFFVLVPIARVHGDHGEGAHPLRRIDARGDLSRRPIDLDVGDLADGLGGGRLLLILEDLLGRIGGARLVASLLGVQGREGLAAEGRELVEDGLHLRRWLGRCSEDGCSEGDAADGGKRGEET